MTDSEFLCVHLRIRGRVQGVFFRANARNEATRLGLSGWVRNMPDGSVEALAHGPAAAVADFVDWCAEGPPSARVDSVEREERADATGAGIGPGFNVTFTTAG